MKKYQFLILCFLVAFQGQAQTSSDHPGSVTTVSRSYPNSEIDGYSIYVPNSVKKNNKDYPLIVFLQGGRGVGGEVDVVLNWGLPAHILESNSLEKKLDRYLRDTFIVVMPHIRSGQFYNNEAAVRAILGQVIAEQPVDTSRMYLTGLSRGGSGCWGLASRMSAVFAAVAPICGANRGITDYESLRGLPIWTTHSTDDRVLDYAMTEETVERIEQLLGVKFHRTTRVDQAKYKERDRILTSPESSNHDSWTELYTYPGFYEWLLRHKK